MKSILQTTGQLAEDLEKTFASPDGFFAYHPLIYAWNGWQSYVERYAKGPVEALFIGMNPGPFGMTQTGVPFGAVPAVRDFLQLSPRIVPPKLQHPKRPILGMACRQIEVSGKRLWEFAQSHFGSAAAFFQRFFVYNYCPVAFMTDSGRNLTPDKLPLALRRQLFNPCNMALSILVKTMRPKHIIGIGGFAQKRAEEALGQPTQRILHPSPASPLANSGWGAIAYEQLSAMGVKL